MSEPLTPEEEEWYRGFVKVPEGDLDTSMQVGFRRLLATLDAERARTGVLTEALRELTEHRIGLYILGAEKARAEDPETAMRVIAERDPYLGNAIAALKALAVLPVDRVGVEPLDVPAGKADWGPLGESGVGVVAKVGLDVARLAEVLRGRTAKSGHILPPLVYGAGGARFMDPDEFAADIAARLIESPTEGETP